MQTVLSSDGMLQITSSNGTYYSGVPTTWGYPSYYSPTPTPGTLQEIWLDNRDYFSTHLAIGEVFLGIAGLILLLYLLDTWKKG